MTHFSSLTCSSYHNSVIDLLLVQYNLVNTDTKWTCHGVCIKWAFGKKCHGHIWTVFCKQTFFHKSGSI